MPPSTTPLEDSNGPKFSIPNKKPVFGPKKLILTKMDDFIVFNVLKMEHFDNLS